MSNMDNHTYEKRYFDTASNSKIADATFIGRFDFSDPSGPVFGWPGSSIKARFRGTGISVNMKLFNPVERVNWFNIIVDNHELAPFPVDRDGAYTLVSGLPDKEHEITLYKRTGPVNGELQFWGFILEQSGIMLPPPARAQRKIEFIGDSITNGYGNEAPNAQEGYKDHQENNFLAFGSIAARELGAEHTSIAWGGMGAYRNGGGDTEVTLPVVYLRTLPKYEHKLWNFENWLPDVAVINLGTNDFAKPGLDTEAFVQAYKNLISFVKQNYSGVHVFCVAGPMDHRAKEYLIRIVNEAKAKGDKKVHYVEFPVIDEQTEGFGGDYHPSVKTHLRAGKQLAEEIRLKLGW